LNLDQVGTLSFVDALSDPATYNAPINSFNQHMLTFSPGGILATDLVHGLRCIPAGFYVTVQVDGAKWWTTNKPVHVPSYRVQFRVYASFELGPMLGELLRIFEASIGELLDRSENPSCQ